MDTGTTVWYLILKEEDFLLFHYLPYVRDEVKNNTQENHVVNISSHRKFVPLISILQVKL